jgi:C-terminal processing protease CtpA/Prc
LPRLNVVSDNDTYSIRQMQAGCLFDLPESLWYKVFVRILILVVLFNLLALPAFSANTDKRFGGVGIDGAPLSDGQIEVRQIVAGGPAHQAGVKVGDIITHIDGKSTLGSDFQQMVQKRLRGVSGTPVVLKIKRKGEPKPLQLKMQRRQLQIESTGRNPN